MDKPLLVVKIGGNIINDSNKLDAFLADFAALQQPKILIHGGGKMATQLSEKMQIPTQMVEGRRITTQENLEVVTMVYAGWISKTISAKLQHLQCNALGLAGSDANCIQAKMRAKQPIDFGYVGDIDVVNGKAIDAFLKQGITPVFSAICHDGKGQLLNTNADTIAAEIAIAMRAFYPTNLLYCFEKKGVLRNVNDDNSVIENINTQQYQALKTEGVIHDGMLPKLQNCFYAIENKVQQVKIADMHYLGNPTCKHTTLEA